MLPSSYATPTAAFPDPATAGTPSDSSPSDISNLKQELDLILGMLSQLIQTQQLQAQFSSSTTSNDPWSLI
ncbi:hypothetical protein [Janthinobacterium agaricidamnosum]|uniref:hypothetical protein n=1 Tax=Janthinobacterium agaricidamnosum TaxID=55508 RepID=UPI000ABDC13A|nr:hypothetical protein [Janthinobacterium agaricidamnosum]